MNVYPSSPAATNERMDPERTHYRSSGIKEASDSSHQKKLQGHHSMRVMALQLPWYFSPADGVASQVATPEFGLLNYQAASVNLKKRRVCTFSDDCKYPFSHLVCRQTGIYQHLNPPADPTPKPKRKLKSISEYTQ